MKNFVRLSKNEMKMVMGGVLQDPIGGGDGGEEAKCNGTCASGSTCKVPTACTQCGCVNSSGTQTASHCN